ncbi:MAG: 3-oxoadipate enol-lactonase [Jatrophihabitantaceae bacterium]
MSDLYWREDGPAGAPPLVLLNSLGTTTEMWAPLLAPLAEQFRVIRVDFRGHGGSPPSEPGSPCRIEDLGRDVLAVLDRVGVRSVFLAGLSIGGMTAMWLAAHHPARVRRLAVLCTSAYLPPEQGWLDRAATVRDAGLEAVADAVVGRWITPDLALRDDDLLTGLRAMLTSVDAEGYAQCCEAIGSMDLRDDLPRIAAPTVVVAGAEDLAIAPSHADVIVSGVAGARLDVLSPAAHLATVEQPGAIARTLLAHFGGGGTLAAGFATRRAVLGDAHVDRAVANTTEFSAPFQDLITRYAWGDVWTRPGLGHRDRSIATLAALVTLGAEHEIALHVRAALRNGLSRDEIGEVLLHTAVYAGVPRANRAFAVARSVFDATD